MNAEGSLSGIILVDKPEGMTSFSVVSRIRKILHTKKAGHAGTLDPFATGLLTVAVGKGTRVLRYMEKDDKTYRALMELGTITSTGDRDGETVGGRKPDREEAEALRKEDFKKIRESVSSMIGDITQVPSMYSAIKIKGRPAYDYARKGETVEIPERHVTIYDITIHRIYEEEETFFIDMTVHCSKGTYIRSLCEDIGEKLGFGAYCKELRRISCGHFSIEEAVTLEELEEKYSSGDGSFLKEEICAMGGLLRIEVSEKEAADLRNGKKLDFSAFKDRMETIEAGPSDRILAVYDGKPVAVIYSEEEEGSLLIREERVFA